MNVFEAVAAMTRPEAPVKWYDRVRNEAPLAHLYQRRIYEPSNVRFQHGPGFNDCEICEFEITEKNPGKRVTLEAGDQKTICHVCDECFNDPDYQDIIKRYPIIQIENYL